jgi:RNA polymerase sigma-70 factor (ECF subfamily)
MPDGKDIMINSRIQEGIFRDAREDEALLVVRVRNGDESAYKELIDRHRARLIRTASNILRDPIEAEDVAQEAFLKAYRELCRLREDRAFASFIYRICVRLCVDRLRLRRAEPSPLEPSEQAQNGSIENKVLIEKLLAQLPPDLKTTLILREVEQLSYEEVAVVMKVPVGTVRSRLHTARERFRTLWVAAHDIDID